MRTYLGLVAKTGRLTAEVLQAAGLAAVEAIPAPADQVRSDHWLSERGDVALLAWTNEPESEFLPVPLRGSAGRVLGYAGYLAEPADDEQRLLNAEQLAPVTERLGGCFSVFRADEHGVEAATAIARVNPVYYAQVADLYAVGSRALLVHLVARACETGSLRPTVDIDIMALQPMVRHGFFTNDETPFRGVRALPAASVLTLRRDGLNIREGPMPEPQPAPRSAAEARARVAKLAEALLHAAKPLARHREPVALALSGGRDSRVMAAVLTAAGVSIRAKTHGFSDDPDVILGTQIAAALGIEHHVDLDVRAQRADSVVVGHPLARAHHVIRMCEGMTSAYELVNGWAPYDLTPRTSGSGGETLRGGFLYDQKDRTPNGIRNRVKTLFRAGDMFLTPDARARADRDHRPWDERANHNGFDVLDKLYLFYRSGRWIVGSHTATLLTSPYYHPFFDNRVVREALDLPPEWRSSEEVIFRLLETLAPPLAAIPPEGKRWRFERNRPRLSEWRAWRRRAAVRPKGRTAGFNWRKQYDENFLTLLRDQVESSPPGLFDVVDKRRCKELFAAVPTRWPYQTWHIYTLSVLLSGSWREPIPELPDVSIPIPT